MLGKFFGKKKSGYFLELSEDEISASSEASEKSALEAPQAAEKPAVAAATTATAATTAPAPAAAVKESVSAISDAVSKASEAMPQKAASPAPLSDPLELIRTALASSANTAEPKAEVEAESNFSTDYLVPRATARRRRPGPSLSSFRSMAKDMRRTTAGF